MSRGRESSRILRRGRCPEPEEIEYKQWLSTDRTTLVSVRQARDEFIDRIVGFIARLRSHHFVAQAQNAHLKELKGRLTSQEAIFRGDFAENYSFVVQDAIRDFIGKIPKQLYTLS